MILGAAAGRGPSPLRLLAACLALGCLVVALHLLRPELLVRLDLAVYDRLVSASRLQAQSGRVTLVAIDERTLAEAGRWPWPRDRVAALLDRVRSLGAAAIGLDVLFAEPDAAGEVSAGPGGTPPPAGEPPALSTRDAALAAVLARGPFVSGYAFTFDRAVDRPLPSPLDRPRARADNRDGHASAAGGRGRLQPVPARERRRRLRLPERRAGRGRDSPPDASRSSSSGASSTRAWRSRPSARASPCSDSELPTRCGLPRGATRRP